MDIVVHVISSLNCQPIIHHPSPFPCPSIHPPPPDKTTIPPPPNHPFINVSRRRPPTMSSKYESKYSDLQSHLSTIKPQLISIDDEITKLLSASTSDEITDLSASIAKGVDNIHSIILDYSEIVASIKDTIESMEEDAHKEEEQQQFENKMDSTDGSTGLQLNPRIIKPSTLSTPPVHPSTSIHSTHDNHVPSVPSIDSTAVFQSLIDRITTIESNSKHTPNLSLPPIKLECFDGSDITKYQAYKYQLDELILKNSSLNEVEKAYHVRSSLKGATLSLVSSIPTHQNFLKRIIERLELEYGRSDLTQATLLQSLLRIRAKSIKLDDQLDAVRSMINLQLVDRIHPRFIAVVWKRKPTTLLAALEFIEETLRLEQEEATITNAISEHLQSTSIHDRPAAAYRPFQSIPHAVNSIAHSLGNVAHPPDSVARNGKDYPVTGHTPHYSTIPFHPYDPSSIASPTTSTASPVIIAFPPFVSLIVTRSLIVHCSLPAHPSLDGHCCSRHLITELSTYHPSSISISMSIHPSSAPGVYRIPSDSIPKYNNN
ncbi:hypothetical protein PRIPAC_72209 [Pristionchus pacificus]|uniref:Uncharacterized protein n=1 Tax=Pristionchus pacificus TaxID=54126 RepID=A0A2A6CFJ4_PRIPA|nr:hypothetical protein PRIPAC_72209 [Pristionchus pacificus]|eukprot:PDM76847.1 hypothetical protein PRIPAC_42242 [Pristionchus pacificus]